MSEEKMKIEFAPGCFDGFEGTQEELDELIREIQSMFEGKTKEEIQAQSTPLTEESFNELSEEEQLRLMSAFMGLDEIKAERDSKLN
jgi:hypothetical protein